MQVMQWAMVNWIAFSVFISWNLRSGEQSTPTDEYLCFNPQFQTHDRYSERMEPTTVILRESHQWPIFWENLSHGHHFGESDGGKWFRASFTHDYSFNWIQPNTAILGGCDRKRWLWVNVIQERALKGIGPLAVILWRSDLLQIF
jgi:hypothetical protein